MAAEMTPDDRAKLNLLCRAVSGDDEAVTAVEQRMESDPSLVRILNSIVGDSEQRLLRLVGQDRPVLASAVGRKLDRLRAEIAGGNPTPLESLIVRRIGVCWIGLELTERSYVLALESGASTRQLEFWERSQGRAQRRYLAAIKSLAQVRRLLGPSVQVNIAEQQVNVAG